MKALRLMRRIRPVAVVGFGGYPTLPPVLAATLRRIPTVIHDANAVMGRANRMLAPRVSAIATSFPGHDARRRRSPPRRRSPAIRCGRWCSRPPRSPIAAPAGGPFRLLVTGGSQGARVMADVVPPAVEKMAPDLRARLDIVQQARGEDETRVARGLCAARRQGRGRAVLPRPAGAHRGRASDRVALRRLDGRRACGDRAAVDPGAVAARARPGPARQRQRAGERRRRDRAQPGRFHARAARRRDRRASPPIPGRLPAMAAGAKSAGVLDAADRLADLVLRDWSHADTCAMRTAGSVRTSRGIAHMKLPTDIGPIHFVGIGGIGMSGIAEVLINLGYTVQGSDASDSANVKRLRDKGAKVAVGHAAENLGDAEVVVVSTAIKRDNPELAAARAKRLAGGAARRDAGRADAAEALRRDRRHARQDHDHLDGRGPARRRRLRSDRDQWRHHQRLRHQCAARRRRLDGGRGRRVRRHVPQASGRRRDRHQYRSRASRSLQDLRGDRDRVREFRHQRAVLRLRRDVHRSSGGADAGRAHRGPPRHHLWGEPAGRCAARRSRPTATAARSSPSRSATAPATRRTRSPACRCRCRGGTTRSMPPRRSRSRASSAFRTTRSARVSRASAA